MALFTRSIKPLYIKHPQVFTRSLAQLSDKQYAGLIVSGRLVSLRDRGNGGDDSECIWGLRITEPLLSLSVGPNLL